MKKPLTEFRPRWVADPKSKARVIGFSFRCPQPVTKGLWPLHEITLITSKRFVLRTGRKFKFWTMKGEPFQHTSIVESIKCSHANCSYSGFIRDGWVYWQTQEPPASIPPQYK